MALLPVLIVSSLLLGLGTLGVMFACAFRRSVRQNRLWRLVATFGSIGLAIPIIFSAVNGADSAGLLWPTSIMLMAGEKGDSISAIAVVLGMATLSNIGIYGIVGLVGGAVWIRIRPKSHASLGDQ